MGAFLAAHGVELAGEAERHLRSIATTHTRETYLRGSAREAELETALALERACRARLEEQLREAGVTPATARRVD